MKGRQCQRCAKDIPPGGLAYVAQVRVYADFDGVILEPEEEIDQYLERIFKEAERSDPRELEKEVYEEFTLLLCKSCRDRFAREAQHPWEGPFLVQKKGDDLIH